MEKTKRGQALKRRLPVWQAVICAAAVCAIGIGIWLTASGGANDRLSVNEGVSTEESTQAFVQEDMALQPSFPIELQQLRILHAGEYSGIYMEDGSNEIVSGVMMLVVENTSEQDLQLARIDMEYLGLTAVFEATNIPAGEKVVLLEKNRSAAPQTQFFSASCRNVVYFPEKMSLKEEILQIDGKNGALTVTNISDTDIPGDILIYYKNSASDMLYGGITYRVRIQGGLAAGETAQIVSAYYTPDSCRLVMVTCAQE